jgi:signal transduction histidine kinase
MTVTATSAWAQRWQRFSAASVRGFHSYANWLVAISWKRFVVLSVLLLIFAGVLQHVPPFSWTYTRMVSPASDDTLPPEPPEPPAVPGRTSPPRVHIEPPSPGGKVEIVIDERGVRITPRGKAAAPAAPTASAAPASASATPAAPAAASTPDQAAVAAAGASTNAAASGIASDPASPSVVIRLPPGASAAVKNAVEEARQAIEEAVQEARQEAESARRDADQVVRDAEKDVRDAERQVRRSRRQQQTEERISLGEYLPSLAMLWIVASLITKISYKRQIQAEAQAAQAVETAESESLKRQVVEARMAAMQAQVEPHFLFNTLASIDHLIEVDPPRASQMQKNLIALLRASMPTMREANGDGGVSGVGGTGGSARDLGRELAVIRPYLEILKVRMEERLSTEIDVPEGLLSAEFPQMMVQTLVENAIKHGLEPKPEGGKLVVKAEIVHGKLAVTVADTGLGFGRAASSGKTAGTGVGLANIRERLQLLYGNKATLTITENPGGGTRVVLAVPYKPVGSPA